MQALRHSWRWLRNLAIGALVAVFVLFTLGPLVLPRLGADLLAVRSGSMAPSLPTGSLVLTTDYSPAEASRLPVGKVITFNEPGQMGKLVTHRIHEVKNLDGRVVYRTKGDANGIVDTWEVSPGDIVGSPELSLSYAGYAYVFLTRWPMRIGIALMILLLAWMPKNEEPAPASEAPASA